MTVPPGVQRTTITTNGITLSALEAGAPTDAETRPLVVLCHGFPELAYSWRHQLPALADAGWHAVAPDQRGYGASERPEGRDDYDIEHLTDDLAGIMDAFGHERAVVVGHDWGAIVAWSMAQRLPDRVRAVVGASVPLVPRPSGPPTQILRAVLEGQFFYMLHFQEPGVAEADLGADVTTTLRRFLAGLNVSDDPAALADMLGPDDGRGMVERMPEPEALPDWLSDEDLATYVAAFSTTGFTGALNWYRNLDRNWERSADWGNTTVTCPSLFIGGTNDPVLLMTPPSGAHALLADHRGDVLIEGAGHWVQQERPDAFTAALVEFLDAVRPNP
jgi:pimeloyl-ACP methyl ester carboxylesterase